ncbi:PAS domain S-box-containing protein/diguanylate cyclase (GGDEF) domain-containing protein [Pseudoxanthobacter soli DSM 19599]|uniref:PAS domain S-box-containing protein/diguanylate cyclase (GGDEF) domain-containing protein n=1 Tax=Pseudoxanthobacter soli DSM 19599 TaxID=1123029 RepID=A0A1M7Z822_9HYPH|nr:EAL domain-containing protein [Pseudoxanthobacter soli]SHO60994.1 PAS domain S-box-containing protein/diguanylate cyclase (GGDEF) domain-containing protein [Pseudoxanthobacter soli DSM 19599]
MKKTLSELGSADAARQRAGGGDGPRQERRFAGSLAANFALFVILLSVAPLCVQGVMSYHVASSTIRDLTARNLRATLASEADFLTLQVNEVERLVTAIAGIADVRTMLAALPPAEEGAPRPALVQETIRDALSGYLALRGIVAIDVIDTQGNYFRVGAPPKNGAPGRAERDRMLLAIRDGDPSIRWLGADTVPGGDPSVVTFGIAVHAIGPSGSPDKSLPSAGGDMIGALIVHLSADELFQHLRTANSRNPGTLLVVARDGVVLFAADGTRIGQPAPQAVIDAISGDEPATEAFIDGQRAIVAYAEAANIGWFVVNVTPLASVEAPARAIGILTVLILGGSLVIVIVAGILGSNRIVRPIRALIDRFKTLEHPTADLKPLPVVGTGETAELTHWFNVFLASEAERRHAAMALKESEERYALAVRGANDALWDWDLRSDRIYYSPRWKALLGLEEDVVLNDRPDTWTDSIHPDDRENVLARIAAHLENKAPQLMVEHRLRQADGSYIWVLARGVALRDDEGMPYRMAGSHTDITSRKRAEEQLRHDAMHDTLTGLPNRRAMFRMLSLMMRESNRHGKQTGLLIIDIDRFKDVNDSLGHKAGDAVLVAVASRLRREVREIDVVARLGGDEFAIIFPNIDSIASMPMIADRIVGAMRKPVDEGSERYSITVTAGATASESESAPELLLREADLALFEAKRSGRNRFSIYNERMEVESRRRLAVENALRSEPAIDAIRILLQAQVNPVTWRTTRFEVLSRWRSADGTVISPVQFVEAAEHLGLMHDMTRAIIRRSIEAIEYFDRRGHDEISLAINLSPSDLEHVDFSSEVLWQLAGRSISPKRLQFEIIESTLLRTSNAVVSNIRHLVEAGCTFAIDDFGTGFSALSYLSRFPIDTIKIDKSFVVDTGLGQEPDSLIRAIIGVGHSLSMRVVAEGVETPLQAQFLAAEGCTLLQGYLFSMPVPVEEAVDLLKPGIFEQRAKAGNG